MRLASRGVINNAAFYRPNDNLTRAEYLKIVIRSTGWIIPATGLSIPFNDVSENQWYAPYVSLALSKGMITSANMSFHPNSPITRAEATKIIVAALGVNVSQISTFTFTDLDHTSDLSKYVEMAKIL